ncbi:CHASE domain-containing protein [Ideonella sp. A 288]|uniref:CHASE domain-containing protein n=1 Tax=Ideonella sp. A 288 TaxID=1962181 RepID=UPI000B4B3E7D|nr:CHASE domain-containing protein [Ideonella sp. A 288]
MEVIEHHAAGKANAEPPAEPQSGLSRLLQRPSAAGAILACAMLLSLATWWVAQDYARREERRHFEHQADELHERIADRMDTYETLLRGGVALFAGSGDVTRDDWRSFVQSLGPRQHYPGIQGMGVARRMDDAILPAQVQRLREQGLHDYTVRPPGPRAVYGPIIYLEPQDALNQRALGFDMTTESNRREAMERARDTSRAALSGPVRLVQEVGSVPQVGFLLYLPLYRDIGGHYQDSGTADSLWGWVYAPFRAGDLMEGILGKSDPGLGLTIEDMGRGPGTATVLFHRPLPGNPGRGAQRTRARELQFAGREWRVTYQGAHNGLFSADMVSAAAAALGLVINLALYRTIQWLSRRRQDAEDAVADGKEQLRARHRWLDALSGLSPDGALVFERDRAGDFRLVFTNPAFSLLFGLRPDDLLGLSEPAVDEWLQGLAAEGGAMPTLDGHAAQLRLVGPPLRELQRTCREDGVQRVYYFRDMTRESEVDRLKSEFITTAAHELRTPLASVYGYAELLATGALPPARRDKAAEVVYRQAGVLKHLVTELMDLARLDARGGNDFDRAPHRLGEVLESAIESLADPLGPPRITLVAPAEDLWADIDAPKVHQVVVNLLSNAFKYSAAGTPVTVTLRRAASTERSMAEVEVADQGMGMTPDQCAHAFERFYRADPSGHVLGAGLGLAIAKEIVELHGGCIDLRSQPGVGTTVTLSVPLAPAPTTAAVVAAESADLAVL